MSKLLFVVHRYAPFPGGSEIYVRNMAEEARERGHEVWVLAATHDPEVLKAGHLNGVKVTKDHNVLLRDKWDLIIVHGGDVSSQNVVHRHAEEINKINPVLYMIIKPSESAICLNGLKHHKYIGYSTEEDYDLGKFHDRHGALMYVRHGIRITDSVARDPEHKWSDTKRIVSVGGFWPHKGMQELAEVFAEVFPPKKDSFTHHAELCLYGYDCEHLAPKGITGVHTHFGKSRDIVMNAIAGADLYVMNSTEEGFGLVLLEAMVNKTPWAARHIAGAKVLKDYGYTYHDATGLKAILMSLRDGPFKPKTQEAYDFVVKNHSIRNTVDDIEKVLAEAEFMRKK